MRFRADTISDLIDKLDPNSKTPGRITFAYTAGGFNHGRMKDLFNYGRALGLEINTWERGFFTRNVAVRIAGPTDDICKLMLQINHLLVAG